MKKINFSSKTNNLKGNRSFVQKAMVSVLSLVTLIHVESKAQLADSKRNVIQNQQITQLATIRDVFKGGYAPTVWKESYISGWSLDSAYEKAEKSLLECDSYCSPKQYQKILKDFFAYMKDYHVGIIFNSSERASLPFTAKKFGDKYYIVYVDTSLLSNSAYPINVGDELVLFNGENPEEEVKKIVSEITSGKALTDHSLSELRLTRRSAALGMEVPKGSATIQIRKDDSTLRSYQLSWNYVEDPLREESFHASSASGKPLTLLEQIEKKAQMLWTPYLAEPEQSSTAGAPINPYGVGSPVSYVPFLGKKITQVDSKFFFNYIFDLPQADKNSRKIIGFIRIPHYSGGAEQVAEFKKIIQFFEDRTDGLIIDQINNPGGSVFYLYALASLLSNNQALTTPLHQVKVSSELAHDAANALDELKDITSEGDVKKVMGENPQLGGYPVNLQTITFIKKYYKTIIDTWKTSQKIRENGETPLTEPIPLYIDQINPNAEVSYSKPILLLINELDFSGGDFFPAIMQDNKRATLLGMNTAGAGGFINSVDVPNNTFGVSKYSFTGSLAKRTTLDGQPPLENLGIRPDVEYSPTEEDISSQTFPKGAYINYQMKIINQIERLINSTNGDSFSNP
ncbi:MAG: protease-like activity factor CPAF [Bdellovibrionales bacterium]|nr:protease-like activity factor CPAF [Bdellovibrionales bacterium]